MKSRVGALAFAGVLLTACTPDKGYETDDVSRSEFGDRWPFTADSGTLACEPGRVPTFTSAGFTVGLDDPDLSAAVWADSANDVSVSKMRDEAMELCD